MDIKALVNSGKSFLKLIFYLGCVSVGGPQSHYFLMQKILVEEKKLISKEDFFELMSFCQILPGPSSTQFITLVGYKKGGMKIAIATILIWCLPAFLMMILIAILLPIFKQHQFYNPHIFNFVICFVLGVLALNALNYIQTYIQNKRHLIILVFFALLLFFFFHSPWIFPIIIVLSIVLFYSIGEKPLKINSLLPSNYKIKKRLLVLFISIFIVAGFLSEKARIEQWTHKKPFNLFENTYRFGSIVFGGGNVLTSMLYEQYAVRSKTKYLDKKDALVGMAFSQIIPGPTFIYATYIGTLIFYREGVIWQIIGGIIATIGIFLPGFLISIFSFQVWEKIKSFNFIRRSMFGIHFSVCVILLGTFIYMFIDNEYYHWGHYINIFYCIYIILVAILLYFKKASFLLLFLFSLLLGFIGCYMY